MISTTIDTQLKKEIGIEFQPLPQRNVSNVLMIILTSSTNTLAKNRIIHEQLIFGKSVLDWVKASGGGYDIKVIEYHQNDNIITLIHPHLSYQKTTLVVYDDTPLLRHATLAQQVSDFEFRGQKVKKLPRGYIFDTEYIKQNNTIYATDYESEQSEDFLAVTSTNSFCIAVLKLKNRIINYHLANEVIILEPNNIYIDADVEIGRGVIIYSNNTLLGHTIIEDNATLYPNNTLKDCYIGANSTLLSCNLENIRLQENTQLNRTTQ